jgi:hypothetical protein
MGPVDALLALVSGRKKKQKERNINEANCFFAGPETVLNGKA